MQKNKAFFVIFQRNLYFRINVLNLFLNVCFKMALKNGGLTFSIEGIIVNFENYVKNLKCKMSVHFPTKD